MARRLLRLMLAGAAVDETKLVRKLAADLGVDLEVKNMTAEQRDLFRATSRRVGRTAGLRRSFAG